MSDIVKKPDDFLNIVPTQMSVTDLLKTAIDKGTDAAALEKLVTLCERIADRSAAQEFASAMSTFQRECPPVPKTSTAKIVTNSGANYSYNFAPLDGIADHVRERLAALGLSYTWDSAEVDGKLQCTCWLRHVNGHKVSSSFTCSTESQAKVSMAQKAGGALTYAKRQSLLSVLGLSTADPDADGADDVRPQEKITDHQAANLDALIDDVGADRTKFLRFMGVQSIADIPASRFQEAVKALESKRGAR